MGLLEDLVSGFVQTVTRLVIVVLVFIAFCSAAAGVGYCYDRMVAGYHYVISSTASPEVKND
ncbi:hypothetical protein LNAOJCKE_0383 [Methylorubrum aminovorans]|uniref:Uncharacterized protein n=1 Tax=Methylorubrum aminovorans TaxID=269069 RepID=A0ABQ4U7K8_9HYPH|nr:hypothetical protein LNAOJCKE_0383 [Methylorubrum aminovorans]